MTVETFKAAMTTPYSSDMVEHLSAIEIHLCSVLTRVEIIGKCGKHIPVLLTTAFKNAVDIIIEKRKEGAVLDSNVFVLRWCEIFDKRSVGDRFRINRGSAHRCFIELCHTIKKFVYLELICWPATPDECQSNAEKFKNLYRFPGCVGCVDGCHVPIKPPNLDRDSYINMKRFASVNMPSC